MDFSGSSRNNSEGRDALLALLVPADFDFLRHE
jgi:hypothetical protein